MKLATLTARNFKGLSFALSLTDITFIVGSNFAGKTARTDAIRFLLLGYLPELGKTNVASFGLASGREMVVEGTFDNGLTIRRRRYLQGDSVKAEDTVPEEIEKAGQLAVMLNAETYFALSDRERVAYVFANIPMGAEWTIANVLDKVNATLTERFANAPSVGKVIQSLEDVQGIAGTPQTYLEASLATMTAQLKDAKAYAARMEGTIQGLAALRLADANVKPTATIEGQLARLNDEAETIRQQMSDLKASADQQRANSQTRTRLQRELAGLITTANTLPTHEKQRLELAKPKEITEDEVFAAHNQHGQAQNEIQTIRAAQNRHHASRKEGNQALAGLEALKVCPCCGASGEGWKIARTRELQASIEELSNIIEEGETHLATALEQERIHATHLTALQSSRKDYLKSIEALRMIDERIAQARDAVARINTVNDTLATIPAEDAQITAKMETLKTALTVNARSRDELEQAHKQSIGRQQDLKRLSEAEKQRDDTKVDIEAITVAGKRLREIQSEMVKAAFAPLLNTANAIFGTILSTPIAYNEGEIGTWRAGVWVTHRTFSGTEKALTYAAIQAALTASSPIRITMLDELGRIHTDNLGTLLDSIRFAVDNKAIDQFVGIDAGRAEQYQEMIQTKDSQVILLS